MTNFASQQFIIPSGVAAASALLAHGGSSSSSVILEGRQMTKPDLDRRVVFQNDSLLPWLTFLYHRFAHDNVG